ncbi:MAG: hypothetical protein K0R26_1167 [Bacteroidota bacterium]|jgi:pimeloyl-ACP methyl ester carboxylesterase|nr:hypothetical protein [Bacteroidota bacterium]
MNKKYNRLIKIVTIAVLVMYTSICALLYFGQDNLLFHPKPLSVSQVGVILKSHSDFDTLSFTMSDGNRTSVFISKDTLNRQQPLVIYFGGNAEEVSHLMQYKSYFPNSILVLVNYRSFGLSKGVISEKTMFSDALEVYDQMSSKLNIDSGKIVVIGRSIGTGVATYLSSQRKTKATVLITPYENMIEVAYEKYPFVPIGLLIKHRFESDKYATKINSPMMAIIATNDEVIPRHHAYSLIKAWKGHTKALEVKEDHSSIMSNKIVWQNIQTFVKDQVQ